MNSRLFYVLGKPYKMSRLDACFSNVRVYIRVDAAAYAKSDHVKKYVERKLDLTIKITRIHYQGLLSIIDGSVFSTFTIL